MQTEIVYISRDFENFHTTQISIRHLAYWLEDLGLSTPIRTQIIENETSLVNYLDSAIKRSFLTIIINDPNISKSNNIRRIIAKIFKRNLVLNDNILTKINKNYEQSSLDIPSSIQTDALLPRGSIMLKDETGTPVGFIIEEDGKFAISLPSSLKKIKYIFKKAIAPLLLKKAGMVKKNTRLFYVRTCGLGEDEIKERIVPIFNQNKSSYYLIAHEHGVDVGITTPWDEQDSNLKELLIDKLGLSIYSFDITKQIEKIISELFEDRDIDLAVAESCTGGLIGHRITQVPNSSKYFKYSVVAYSNLAKQRILGISSIKLKQYGAVSAEIAEEMAYKVKQISGTTIGLSVTGIAGPGGETADKPVGLVFCGLSTTIKTISQSFYFKGDRGSIKLQASQMALNMLREFLILGKKWK